MATGSLRDELELPGSILRGLLLGQLDEVLRVAYPDVEDVADHQELVDFSPVVGTDPCRPCLVLAQQTAQRLPTGIRELQGVAVRVGDFVLLKLVVEQEILELRLLLDVALLPAGLDLVERGLGDVDEPRIDQLRHLPEEQGQSEGSDVGAIDVGVSHQNDLVVPGLLDVELVTDTGPDRCDQRLDLVVLEDLVDPALLDVEDLAPQGKNRLGVPVSPL